jgi:hypothetical protein
MSGLVDPNTVKQLSKIAGVDAIVTGTVTPFGDSIRVSVKVIATDTAKIITASNGDIPKTKAIEDLIERGIETAITSTPTTPKPSVKAQYIAEAQGFLFELQGCKLSGGNVQCKLLVTNNEKVDRELQIYTDYTRIFDNFGNVYGADTVQLGNKKSGWYVELKLVSGIPTKSILDFSNVSPEATSIAALEIGVYSEGKRFTAKFRNIPLSR